MVYNDMVYGAMTLHHHQQQKKYIGRLLRRRHVLPLFLLFLPKFINARAWQSVNWLHSLESEKFRVRAEESFEMDPFAQHASLPTPAPVPTPSSTGRHNIFVPQPSITPNEPDTTRPPAPIMTESPAILVDKPHESIVPPTMEIPTGNPPRSAEKSPAPTETIREEETFIINFPDSVRFPNNPDPDPIPIGYFNYDVREGARYGPGFPAWVRGPDGRLTVQYGNNAWQFAQTREDAYWNEFSAHGFGTWNGTLATFDFSDNQCGKGKMQSPIDIRLSGVACVEHHQIRTLRGDFRLSGGAIKRSIEPNKLRLTWPRRPCPDMTDERCAEPDPPRADFPFRWTGHAEGLHMDFKVPSEHRIYGKQFDAEMQIYHLHTGNRRVPAISVLIQAEEGGHNSYLQPAIDAFQHEYDRNRAICAARLRSQRKLLSDFHKTLLENSNNETTLQSQLEDYDSWADYSTALDDPDFMERTEVHDRKLSQIFNPYHEELMPTFWFYGYVGSLTEPPCTEMVSWFVMDTPMIVSPEQLNQMKMILFTHINGRCFSTSNHFKGSVARPIQESAGREVWKCTRQNFIPDHERDQQK